MVQSNDVSVELGEAIQKLCLKQKIYAFPIQAQRLPCMLLRLARAKTGRRVRPKLLADGMD